MVQTFEAVIDENGTIRLLEAVHVDTPRRALVTVLEEEPTALRDETPLLSEAALADDWNRPSEDAGWSHLQPAK